MLEKTDSRPRALASRDHSNDSSRREHLVADLRGEIQDLRFQNGELRSARLDGDTEIQHLQQTIAVLESALEGAAPEIELAETAMTRAKAALPDTPHIDSSGIDSSHIATHELHAALAESTRHARALQQHIDNIEASRGWRLFNFYRRVKDSVTGRADAGPTTST